MADRIIKPDDTNDLVLQNNDGSAKLELNEDQTVKIIGTIDTPGLVVQRNHAVFTSSQGLNVISEPTSSSGVTTSNYIDSGLTTSITPKKTGNKIIVICSYIFGMTANATTLALIRRTGPSVANSANIASGGDARKASNVLLPFGTHSSGARYSASIVWEDIAQDTTTTHVYTFCGSFNGTGTAFYLNGSNTTYTGQSTITVLEIVV